MGVRSKIRHIAITNIVVLNGGDGAILFGMLRILRLAFGEDCLVSVFSSDPETSRRMYPEIDFKETLGLAATHSVFGRMRYIGRIFRTVQQWRYLAAAWGLNAGFNIFGLLVPSSHRESLRTYRGADLVVSGGGTYLKEEYGITSQYIDYTITLLLRRPLAFFTQSLGPFIRPDTRTRMKSIFRRAVCLVLRDERSRQHVRDLGDGLAPVHLAADAAFALADPEVIEKSKYRSLNPEGNLKVAVSVRYWPHFSSCSNEAGMSRYRRSVAEAVRKLVRGGADVTFISTCQGIPQYSDDAEEAAEVLALLSEDVAARVNVVSHFVRYDELLTRLRDYDLCIGTRMHMCVLSLIAGTPALPIAYEFKTRELYSSLGLARWVSDIESITPATFVKSALSFIDEMPSLREDLFDRVQLAYEKALTAGECILRSMPEQ